jgi:hypothetical protein
VALFFFEKWPMSDKMQKAINRVIISINERRKLRNTRKTEHNDCM